VSKPVLAAVIFLAVFVAVLVVSTIGLTRGRKRVEVCMQFGGRTNCSIASGGSRESALRTAITTACASISGGVTDSQQCEHSPPVRETWLDK
jgi:hypothetical protein